MSLGQAWIIWLGLVFSIGLVIASLYVLRYYRKRLLPPIQKREPGEALAELHRVQGELRRKLEEGEVPEDTPGVEEPVVPSPAPPAPPPKPPAPPPKPQSDESRKEALEQLQELQAKMRKRLEEDQAREAAEGLDMGSPESGID